MSERSYRRRILSIGRRTRPPQPSLSPHRRTLINRRLKKPPKPVRVLHRCTSEPILWTVSLSVDGDSNQNLESDGVLFRPLTYTDVLATSSFCSSSFLSLSPQNQEFWSAQGQGYKKDAKVVVNVTVEGSPGPIRAMVPLGSSVGDTIRLVIDEYRKEGRSPQLQKDAAAAAFELHHSHFCLQSLNKSDSIGDVGSRSFYLRKSGSISGEHVPEDAPPVQRPVFFFPASLDRRIKKIVRRMRRFWKLLGCLHCE